MTFDDILKALENDEDMRKLAMEGGEDSPEVIQAGMQESAMTQGAAPAEGAGAIPAATATTGAGGDAPVAGSAASSEVAHTLGDNVENQKIKLKEQMMEQAAAETKAKALAEKDELPGQNTAPNLGEMISLGDTQRPTDYSEKMAALRYEELLELGLQKEAELQEGEISRDNYVLGGIFAHGFKDMLEGNEPAMQKEASVLDNLSEYSEAELDEAISKLGEEDVTKLASLMEERDSWNKLACQWYEMGQAYALGMSPE